MSGLLPKVEESGMEPAATTRHTRCPPKRKDFRNGTELCPAEKHKSIVELRLLAQLHDAFL